MSELFQELFIFEMANNHQGSLAHGLNIVRAMGEIARKYKIRGAVKFQYRDLDTFIHPAYRTRTDVKHIPRFISTRLSEIEFRTLVQATRDEGLVTVCTPFDERSVQMILDHEIQIIKVASASAADWALLEEVARAGKPVICSTGGQTLSAIDNIVSFFTHRHVDFALLHCVGVYPVLNRDVQMGFLGRMKRRYSYVPIGYSGHEAPDNLDVVKVAVAMGATILERHVGIATDTIKLNAYSMNPAQVEAWVQSALTAREIVGDKQDKEISPAETESLLSLERGVFALREIAAGETLRRSDVYFAMPCGDGQTTSGEFQEGMVTGQMYAPDAPLYERRKPTTVNMVRSVIHDVKGMLYEAHIATGKEFTLELSHHVGIEHFRDIGAVIINVINREYCKKLVVVLPKQFHPNHRHTIKEETFQLLWGDLTVDMDGRKVMMHPGDQLLVERGVWHNFTSEGGAIVEEVSTTHIKGDSEYQDEAIRRKDPMERKTVLDDW